MSAEVDAERHSNVEKTNENNHLTIDFSTTTTTNSKASIPTGPGMNAIAHLARSAIDAKRGDDSPTSPSGSADGNMKAEADATPDELKAIAES